MLLSLTSALVIPAAFVLDLLIGDPPGWPHPVRWMGKAIEKLEPVFRHLRVPPVMAGGLFALCLIAATWLTAHAALVLLHRLGIGFAVALEVIAIFYCLSVRSLRKAALDVREALQNEGLEAGRLSVGMIVGRDVNTLTERGVIRAAVESVAENLVDGVIAPLTFAAIGGAPLALAYKMVNTLDSMIGYRNETYHQFGKVAARIDDVANWIPARLAVLCIAAVAQLIDKTGKQAIMTAWREGGQHPSPNAGYAEAAFAGALEVRLLGPSAYGGQPSPKPFFGKSFNAVWLGDIQKAVDLMVLASGFFTVIVTLLRAILF
jgi:adenosylcobinamide-phosphate synthase